MPSQTSCRIYILEQMAFSQTFFVSAWRTWRFCKKAVNAEAGSERFDAFIDAGFADIVCRRHQLREWIIWILIVSSFPLARPPQRGSMAEL